MPTLFTQVKYLKRVSPSIYISLAGKIKKTRAKTLKHHEILKFCNQISGRKHAGNIISTYLPFKRLTFRVVFKMSTQRDVLVLTQGGAARICLLFVFVFVFT